MSTIKISAYDHSNHPSNLLFHAHYLQGIGVAQIFLSYSLFCLMALLSLSATQTRFLSLSTPHKTLQPNNFKFHFLIFFPPSNSALDQNHDTLYLDSNLVPQT